MSHITDVKLKVRDLDALEEAAKQCGLELVRDATSFKWFGRFVGDSVPPKGRNPRDYGKCEHKLRMRDAQPGDYEIGIVPALDGDGFDLLVDTWQQQRLLSKVGGMQMNKLRQEYSAAVIETRAQARRREGYTLTREQVGNRILMRMVKR